MCTLVIEMYAAGAIASTTKLDYERRRSVGFFRLNQWESDMSKCVRKENTSFFMDLPFAIY